MRRVRGVLGLLIVVVASVVMFPLMLVVALFEEMPEDTYARRNL